MDDKITLTEIIKKGDTVSYKLITFSKKDIDYIAPTDDYGSVKVLDSSCMIGFFYAGFLKTFLVRESFIEVIALLSDATEIENNTRSLKGSENFPMFEGPFFVSYYSSLKKFSITFVFVIDHLSNVIFSYENITHTEFYSRLLVTFFYLSGKLSGCGSIQDVGKKVLEFFLQRKAFSL